jgi:hypothetical protein
LGVSFSLVPESIRDLTQGVTPIDDRRYPSGLNEVGQQDEILLAGFSTVLGELLIGE